MGAKVIRSIEDLFGHDLWLEIRCQSCGRVASFVIAEIIATFRNRRWNLALDAAPWKLRCRCGSRSLRVGWTPARVDSRAAAVAKMPRPVAEEFPPPGCDPMRFALSKFWEREAIRERHRPPGARAEIDAEWRRRKG